MADKTMTIGSESVSVDVDVANGDLTANNLTARETFNAKTITIDGHVVLQYDETTESLQFVFK